MLLFLLPGIAVCVCPSMCVCVCVCRLLNFDELTAIINLLASHFMPVNNDLCVCACLSMWENVTACVCVCKIYSNFDSGA